jgi:DUF1680 family protein
VTDASGATGDVPAGAYWSSGARTWRAGESVTLLLDLRVRITRPDPRIDAVRGTVALERGPLVYCVETADLPAGVELEQVVLDPAAEPGTVDRPDLGEGIIGLEVAALQRRVDGGAWPYAEQAGDGPASAAGDRAGAQQADRAIELRAIPYFAWANRAVEAMRVWIPAVDEGSDAGQ